MSWIQTYTGRIIDLPDPCPDEINIEDIAHALSMICRFNGHTTRFYSVAEHSLHVSFEVERKHALHALLHDAAEAYIGDLSLPLKPFVSGFAEIEDLILYRIFDRFGVCETQEARRQIKQADRRMLATEREQVMMPCARAWETLSGIEPYPIHLPCWSPIRAKEEFLLRFYDLMAEVPA